MQSYWNEPDQKGGGRVKENWKRIERLCEEHRYAINRGPIRPQTPRMRGLHPDQSNPKWKLSSKTKQNAEQRSDLDQD